MSKSKDFKFSDYFQLPNPGLKSYFGNVVKGSDAIIRAPFGINDAPQTILDQWSSSIERLDQEWPSLVEFENELRAKVGPLSVRKPLCERMDDIESYYEGILLPSEPLPASAIKATQKRFSKVAGLTIRPERYTLENMKKSTNSGSPYFTKRKFVVGRTSPCTLEMADRDVIQHLPSNRYNCCAVIGWRGQEGGPDPDDTKQRVVWMFPFSVNLQELRVYQPLIEACQSQNLVPAWVSMDAVDEEITKLFDTKDPADLVVCTDFAKFDQHFNSDLQSASEQILRYLFRGAEKWFTDVYPIKYMIPLAYEYDAIRYGKHGMGSGSGGTNADETLAHTALQFAAAQSIGQKLNPHSQCLGDDGILSFKGVSAENVMREYTRHGLSMNLDKQYSSTDDCTYLRRWHHTKYRIDGIMRGVYSTYRALGRLMYQERFFDPEVWSKEMVALRQLSIIENVKWHPLRDEFLTFCISRDRYRLGIDIPGFLDNVAEIAQSAVDLMPDFLGYTKSLQPDVGIASWWVVQALKSIS